MFFFPFLKTSFIENHNNYLFVHRPLLDVSLRVNCWTIFILLCLGLDFAETIDTTDTREHIILTEHESGIITFEPQQLSDQSQILFLRCAIIFESRNESSIIFDTESYPQSSNKYVVEFNDRPDYLLTVNLTIRNTSVDDEGVYTLEGIILGETEFEFILSTRNVSVNYPVRKVTCFIMISEYGTNYHEVHCYAFSGSIESTITCYQNGYKLLPYHSPTLDNDGVMRGIFWMLDTTPVSCCAYDILNVVPVDSCNDFEWPFQNNGKIHTTHGPETISENVMITKSSVNACEQPSPSWQYIIVLTLPSFVFRL